MHTYSQDIPGTLADTCHDQMEEGFLSFVRLIGTVYFKKHLAEFTLDTPRALYMSLTQEEEEVLHDDSLRRECGEVCVSDEEGGAWF